MNSFEDTDIEYNTNAPVPCTSNTSENETCSKQMAAAAVATKAAGPQAAADKAASAIKPTAINTAAEPVAATAAPPKPPREPKTNKKELVKSAKAKEMRAATNGTSISNEANVTAGKLATTDLGQQEATATANGQLSTLNAQAPMYVANQYGGQYSAVGYAQTMGIQANPSYGLHQNQSNNQSQPINQYNQSLNSYNNIQMGWQPSHMQQYPTSGFFPSWPPPQCYGTIGQYYPLPHPPFMGTNNTA